MKYLLLIFLLCFGGFAEEEIVDDIELMKQVQKLLSDNGFIVNEKLPKVVYHKERPPYFAFNWAGITNLKKEQIEILIYGNKQFDTDTFYHECYHWFAVGDIGGERYLYEQRAERFAKICSKWFKNKVPKGLVENSK